MNMKDKRLKFDQRVSEEIGSDTSLEDRARVFVDCPDWQPRLTIARDPRTPRDILDRLAEDVDPIVRSQAIRTINGQPTTLRHELGIDLYTARMALGKSRNAIALEITMSSGRGFPQSSIANIEEGRTNYTIDTVDQIMRALGLKLITIVDYPDGEEVCDE